jgi:hexulose-6-phosphate isomerase
MREAAPLAAELGIRIAFENVWNNFLLSPLEAARYSDELQRGVDRPVFGWHFDIGNIVNYGWPEHWIEALGPRILKLDVKEFSRKRRDDEGLWKGFGVEIGEGDVGWDRVRAALRRIGYRGWAAAEVGGGGPERLADIARRMDTVFREDESTGESNP